MFSHASFGATSFDSSSLAREYLGIGNVLTYTQELFVEGVQVVSVDLQEFAQTLYSPSHIRKVKRLTNTLGYTQGLHKPRIKRVNHLSTLNYTQGLNVPVIIRTHYEQVVQELAHIQTLYVPTLPKITTVDSVLAYTQSLLVPTTAGISHINTLEYTQQLYDTQSVQEARIGSLNYVMTLPKPVVKYLTTTELLEIQQTLIAPKGIILIPIEMLEYVMSLQKPIINSYELLYDMNSYLSWKNFEVQREGRKLIVVQEVEHSIDLSNSTQED